jgi:hypothetical protein
MVILMRKEETFLYDSKFRNAALSEHRFWLQILGDHARFILTGLSPQETTEIRRAQHFIETFDNLLAQARRDISDEGLKTLTRLSFQSAKELREFKLHLLRRHLIGEIGLGLPPTFLNHMVNELAEYINLLTYLEEGEAPPVMHPVSYHLLWLSDAFGHADILHNSVDPAEKRIRALSLRFARHFEEYYLKAVEVAGYLRTGLERFPALSRFNKETGLEMKMFTKFLEEIKELELSDQLLGALSPLMPDHMAREECYYLIKLAQSSDIPPPDCDPAKPRVEEHKA